MGDPFGVGCDCLAPAKGFVFCALPDETRNGAPMIVAVPFCTDHELLVVDWVAQSTPIGFEVMPIAWLDDVSERMEREGGELFLYAPAAA